MTAIVVLLILLVVGSLAYLIWRTTEPTTPAEAVDPEQAMKAAVELHRIRRGLDASWTKQQQRNDGAALRREIAEALKPEDDD